MFLPRMSDFAGERIGTLHHFPDLLYFFSSNYWREKKLLKEFDEFFDEVVAKLKVQSTEKFSKDPDSHKKFVDFLFDESNEFSNDEITDHVKAIVYGVR
jgi:hypothetical protein